MLCTGITTSERAVMLIRPDVERSTERKMASLYSRRRNSTARFILSNALSWSRSQVRYRWQRHYVKWIQRTQYRGHCITSYSATGLILHVLLFTYKSNEMTHWNFAIFGTGKLVLELPYSFVYMILYLVLILVKLRLVMDGRTDRRQTDTWPQHIPS